MSSKVFAVAIAIVVVAGAAVWLLLGGGAGSGSSGTAPPVPDAPAAPSPGTDGIACVTGRRVPTGPAAGASRPARTMPPPPTRGESEVSGRVVEKAGGAPIAGASIVLRHPLGEFAVEGDSKADGAFVLDRVPGVVGARVFVTAAGFGPRLIRDVHVPPSDRRDLGSIELERGSPIAGRVLTMLGAPIAGVEVDLLEFVGPPPGMPQDLVTIFRELREDDESLDQVLTSADGAFTFAGAAPGRYLLAARKSGWQVRFTQPFAVVSGEAPPSVEMRLVEGRSIRGIVKDTSGSGIAGAEIAALEVEPSTVFISRSQKTTTGADGRFSYSSFGSGEVAFVVNARGYSGASMANIRANAEEVEFVLRKAARIEGRVFDRSTGKGIAGATVIAFQLTESAALEETRSGPDGAYVIEAGPTGKNVSVIAKLSGWMLASVADAMFAHESANPGRDLSQAIGQDELDAGATVRRDLPMVAGGSVSGRVVDAATGAGITGAEITLLHQSGLEFFGMNDPVLARSGPDGAFTASPVGAGRVTVTAAAEGWLSLADAMPDDEPDADAIQSVLVSQGAAVNGVTVKLRRGADLAVLVTDPDGKPMPGASVTWVRQGEEMVGVFGPTKRPRAVPADAGGRARLKGLPARPDLVVAARHPGFPTGGHVTVDMTSPPASVTVALIRGASLAGVVMGPDGKPAADRTIAFHPEKSEAARAFGEWTAAGRNAVTDASGRFLIENLPPGPGSVGLDLGLRGSATERDDCVEHGLLTVTLAAGKREEVRLQLVRSVTITGTVYDAEGKRLANVSVYANPVSSDALGFDVAQTGDDGTYELVGLCPGTYRLQVTGVESAEPAEVLSREVAAPARGVDFRLKK